MKTFGKVVGLFSLFAFPSLALAQLPPGPSQQADPAVVSSGLSAMLNQALAREGENNITIAALKKQLQELSSQLDAANKKLEAAKPAATAEPSNATEAPKKP